MLMLHLVCKPDSASVFLGIRLIVERSGAEPERSMGYLLGRKHYRRPVSPAIIRSSERGRGMTCTLLRFNCKPLGSTAKYFNILK